MTPEGGADRYRASSSQALSASERHVGGIVSDGGALNLKALKGAKITELAQIAREYNIDGADQHAQAGDDLRHPAGAGRAQRLDPRRRRAGNPARRLRLPARARLQLSARSRRHLYLAEPDSEVQPAHRRHRFGPDSPAQRGRALLRAAQGRIDQLRGAREGARQDPVRQPDAALSAGADQARIRPRGLHHAASSI